MHYFNVLEKDKPLWECPIASRHIFFGDYWKRWKELFIGNTITNWDSENTVVLEWNWVISDIICSSWSLFIVSKKIMELIRQFEPLTEFLPIKVQDQNTAEIEGQFYVVNILNTLTGVIDPKKTTYWYSEIPLKVFLDRSKIWDRALFRIPELSSSIFVREDLGYLLTQAVPGYFEMIEV